jgi:hypothetical protein
VVNLGTNCTNPTGSQSIVCLTGPVATWNNNVGSGGGFTIPASSLFGGVKQSAVMVLG